MSKNDVNKKANASKAKSSIQKKIVILSLSGLLICTALLGTLCAVFVNNLTQENSQRFLEDQANYAVAQISGKFFNVEMYTNALNTAGIAKEFRNLDDVKNDSTRDFHTRNILEHISATIKNEFNSIAVYLRFNPKFAPPTSGISMVRQGKGAPMENVEPTDLSKYTPNDTAHVGSYYIPIKAKAPIWMQPYYKKILDAQIISYVIPLFIDGEPYGIVGVDLNFDELTKEIDSFKYFETGYAYLEDSQGKVVFHRFLNPGSVYKDDGSNTIVHRPLRNGMDLVIITPTSEINAKRNSLIWEIVIFSIVVLLIFGSISIYIARTITKPLKKLTMLANKLTAGDMSVEFNLYQNDEIGELSVSFTEAKRHIQEHLLQMQGLAYNDSLTGIRNKTAYDDFISKFQEKIATNEIPRYGIIIMDTNDLKEINDNYGHENGNVYLINSTKLICRTFQHSPVFRIGGDEFAVILEKSDLDNYKELMKVLREKMDETQMEKDPWKRISIACGISICEEPRKYELRDIFNLADKEMYKDKKAIKAKRDSKT